MDMVSFDPSASNNLPVDMSKIEIDSDEEWCPAVLPNWVRSRVRYIEGTGTISRQHFILENYGPANQAARQPGRQADRQTLQTLHALRTLQTLRTLQALHTLQTLQTLQTLLAYGITGITGITDGTGITDNADIAGITGITDITDTTYIADVTYTT